MLEDVGVFFQELVLDHGFNIVVIILMAWIGRHLGSVLIDRLVRRFIRSTHFNSLTAQDVKKRQDTIISMFGALFTVLVWVVMIITIVDEIGIQTGPLLASAGIIGIALGFGAQSIIKDFLSGIFIIMENQYRVGDVVDLEGAAGTVEKITIRSTILRDTDGNVHYMPNGNIMHVINKTMGFSKVNLSIAVNPDTNIDKLTELIDLVGDKLSKDDKWQEKILEAPHFLSIGSFSELALEVNIIGKTQPSEQWSVTGELRRRLLKEFQKHDIELAAYPVGGIPPSLANKQ